MKKKILLFVALASILICTFAIAVSAKSVYLEPIPDELKVEKDTATHFVVFEEEKYFTGSGSTISGLNGEIMEKDMEDAKIDATKIGKEYLTRFNFPAYFNGTLVTYVNLNSVKSDKYFKHVCGYVQLAGTVNQVHDMHECTNQLRCFDFGENSQVTVIPYCFMQGASKMMLVKNFPRNLETVGEVRQFDRREFGRLGKRIQPERSRRKTRSLLVGALSRFLRGRAPRRRADPPDRGASRRQARTIERRRPKGLALPRARRRRRELLRTTLRRRTGGRPRRHGAGNLVGSPENRDQRAKNRTRRRP